MNLMETKISPLSSAGCVRPGGTSRPASLLLVLLSAFVAPAVAAGPDAPRSSAAVQSAPTYFGGIQVNEPDHDHWVSEIAAAGLDSVQVTLYARQQDWDGAELRYERDAPWVVSEIRAAHRAGLKVVLVMRVALEHGLPRNRHLWHGMIWPRDELLEDWFASYRAFVLWGASIAAAEGVELFAIGNELSSLTSTLAATEWPDLYGYWADPERVAAVREALVQCSERVRRQGRGADLEHLDGGRYATLEEMLLAEDRSRAAWVSDVMRDGLVGLNARRQRYASFWARLIGRVRESYAGNVTYGANFDQVLEVGFWDRLDVVGTTAYFPLAPYGLDRTERVARMERSWAGVAGDLEVVAPGMPVVFLELGWTRRRGSTVRPYSYDRVEVLETVGADRLTCVHWASQPEAPAERVAALQALANVVASGGFDALRGFTLWKLTTRAEHRAIEPFAVLLGGAGEYDTNEWQSWAATDIDRLDAALIGLAGKIASQVRGRDILAR